MKANTQNRFDDFIAAGEYLAREGYAAKDKLAMTGGSHGGCLVGTVMTQRPELFKVALPAVGPDSSGKTGPGKFPALADRQAFFGPDRCPVQQSLKEGF